MKSVSQVKSLIEKEKKQGKDLQIVAWDAARACTGYPYVYGAVGEECRPAKRRQYAAKFYLKGHTTIVTKCKAISWDDEANTAKITGSCEGCKWNLPVMMFDCRGFTRKILSMVYNWTLWGGTVGGQWNDARNWKAKGEIKDGVPADTLLCLFQYNKKWLHTGFGYNEETVECSSGVQYFSKRTKKWTHWAVPACIDGDVPTPVPPEPGPEPINKPTLRRGSTGKYVVECQTDLITLGYDVGSTGADGKFGKNTEAGVKEFQKQHTDADGKKLVVDGVVGQRTWWALDNAMAEKGKE